MKPAFDFAQIGFDRPLTLANVPEGADGLVLGALAQKCFGKTKAPLIHIAKDDARMDLLARTVSFFTPETEVLAFPAWDCLPYDRAGPKADILSTRIGVLSRLANGDFKNPVLLLTTINGILQRVPPKDWILSQAIEIKVKNTLPLDDLKMTLVQNGYVRTDQVAEPGDYALRGGLIDLYPPHAVEPFRIDLFGDEVDTIRTFDPLSQRTTGHVTGISLLPAREYGLDEAAVERFRNGYLDTFGPPQEEDPLYASVKEGRNYAGADHWLPLFHEKLDTLFDYAPGAGLALDYQTSEVVLQRFDDLSEYYLARKDAAGEENRWSPPYKPLPPKALYLTGAEWQDVLTTGNPLRLSPFEEPADEATFSFGAAQGRNFLPEREARDGNVFAALKGHLKALVKSRHKVLITAVNDASRERLLTSLVDHGIMGLVKVNGVQEFEKLEPKKIGLAVLPLPHGFVMAGFASLTETDILGDKLPRRVWRKKRAENFLREASSVSPGDLVVHINHGIGRFAGLEAIAVNGARHDCLKLVYQGDDRLFLPVENIEMLSRFGEGTGDHLLDKLGGAAWQTRHAKLKKRIREMAGKLIEIAAARSLKEGPVLEPPEGLYQEFSARFPYTETDDQMRAIDDVLADLQAGKPMDRLICGDVGFGKTEVALRASLAAVMAGYQVAIITPTTLLSRQHTNTFRERYHGLPVVIEELSRLVPGARAAKVRGELEKGQVDIIIGTHALISDKIRFKSLGLLIVDEEQHFGVAHKERLKALKADVHVLTLSATPIPRTLQMSLSGLKDMSLIATPPVDRLAVRTYVSPFDEVVIREALLREHYRGGQSYYVCPRIADLEDVADFLKTYVPEIRFAIAHGQMPGRRIEDAMTAFYDGGFDCLLCTTIIESGLDIPNVNTIVIHRADMFGLAQLYQLRGRVGRSKTRAYAYLTTPPRKPLTGSAEKRLHVLQSLDTLGAGFTLAAHDMDIRGAGNLLGEEQSGHVKEVGIELYQKMLEEAVAERRTGKVEDDGQWSPQINLGASVLIPENYVADLGLRLALYRRLGTLETREEIEDFGDELKDRFGELPEEVGHLLRVTIIKLACIAAGVDRVETGKKGVIIGFHKNRFGNPAGLADFLSSKKMKAKLRPDHKLIIFMRWHAVEDRLQGILNLIRTLQRIAGEKN